MTRCNNLFCLFTDGFQTDAQITGAKSNGEIQLKQLEQWEPEGSDDTDLHDLNSGLFGSIAYIFQLVVSDLLDQLKITKPSFRYFCD